MMTQPREYLGTLSIAKALESAPRISTVFLGAPFEALEPPRQ